MNAKAKMIKRISIVLIFLFCLTPVSVVAANDFSADVTSTSITGFFQGKIFVTNGKIRIETPESTAITRIDEKVVWLLMPVEKMYMEVPMDENMGGNIVAGSDKVPGELGRKLLGKERIGGKLTKKYRITYATAGVEGVIFSWIDAGTGIPVRTAAEDESWVYEYKNLNPGMQPRKLFEIPHGYQKLSYDIPSLPGMEDAFKDAGLENILKDIEDIKNMD